MTTVVRLVKMPEHTGYAPLAVLGYCLSRTRFLDPLWNGLDLGLKTVDHSPEAKLQNLLLSILAGCRSIAQVNTRLRAEAALAQAWGLVWTDQSNLARTLDAFTDAQVALLRRGSEALFRRESRTLRHDWAQGWLWLDIDLTPLPISKQAEGSTKGKFDRKNRYGRQLARVQAPQYHETLFSHVYPGKQESSSAYVPTVESLAAFLNLSQEQKQRTVLRSDAGFGSDANINYALRAQWQVLTKNKGGPRPNLWAQRVAAEDWQPLRVDRWVARATAPPAYARPTQCLVLRWLTPGGQTKHGIVVSSVMAWSMAETIAHYDERGACETEIQADKGGLRLERRRKKRLAAQEALVLLTDIAHNLLAWVPGWMHLSPPLASWGATRLIEDALCCPGRLYFNDDHLVEVQLNGLHPYAEAIAAGLKQLLAHFGYP
ncbi:MAG: hypothetical protein GXY76_18740 [Chloroflexi bacterium]|nr:hypothetical protein [Chloroflexota bacterium]